MRTDSGEHYFYFIEFTYHCEDRSLDSIAMKSMKNGVSGRECEDSCSADEFGPGYGAQRKK